MHDVRSDVIVEALRNSGDEAAWCAFLSAFAPVLMQVIRTLESDEDRASDAFVFICEQLAANQCSRLRRFDPGGPAQFVTWLRAVARNLCIDFHRLQRGRFRVFRAIRDMPALHESVFRLRHRGRLSITETFALLRPSFPNLTLDAVLSADAAVAGALSSRQVRALAMSRPTMERFAASSDELPGCVPVDNGPSPEELVLTRELRQRVRAAVEALEAEDRMVLALRFDQGLTLSQIAQVAGLRDAQQADRRLRSILQRLRTWVP